MAKTLAKSWKLVFFSVVSGNFLGAKKIISAEMFN